MSLSHSPKIVTDGLVLCLDAANPRSYPKSGATWSDLTSTNTVTLVNGPSFDSDNRGSIVFDGSNDYAGTVNNISLNDDATVECVFKWDDYGTDNIDFLVAGNNEKIEIHTGGGAGTNGLRWIPYSWDGAETYAGIDAQNIITDGINHVTFTCTQSLSVAYKNGEHFKNSSTTTTLTIGSQPVTLGKRTSQFYYLSGSIYLVRIYNRALTADEVRQNYNATKRRFK